MKVSVILPNYNHSSYLKQRIESILNQSYQDFELIILDDCSPDNSKEIIEQYRHHPKVSHIVYNTKNAGRTNLQWQKGFVLAKGEYIWIAESDDYSSHLFLETLINAIKLRDNIVLAFSDSYFVDEMGMLINKSTEHINKTTFYNGLDFVKQKMFIWNSIYNASAVIFKKSALCNVDMSYLNYIAAGDRFFWINIALSGNVVEVPDKLNYFRQHNNKVSPNAKRNGVVYVENHKIQSYLQNKGILQGFKKHVAIGYYLRDIHCFKDFISDEVKQNILSLFKKGTNSLVFSIACFYYFKLFLKLKYLLRWKI